MQILVCVLLGGGGCLAGNGWAGALDDLFLSRCIAASKMMS